MRSERIRIYIRICLRKIRICVPAIITAHNLTLKFYFVSKDGIFTINDVRFKEDNEFLVPEIQEYHKFFMFPSHYIGLYEIPLYNILIYFNIIYAIRTHCYIKIILM